MARYMVNEVYTPNCPDAAGNNCLFFFDTFDTDIYKLAHQARMACHSKISSDTSENIRLHMVRDNVAEQLVENGSTIDSLRFKLFGRHGYWDLKVTKYEECEAVPGLAN